MKLTIIIPDNTVYEDGLSYSDLALDTCNIPPDVRVLQFNTDKSAGWLEFYPDDLGNTPPNQTIDTLPEWAYACMALWDEANQKAQEIPVIIPDGSVITEPALADTSLTETPLTETTTTTTTQNDTPSN